MLHCNRIYTGESAQSFRRYRSVTKRSAFGFYVNQSTLSSQDSRQRAQTHHERKPSMSDSAITAAKKRPEYRNLNAFTDLPSYRLPLAGLVSILHRVSGAIMFVLMPFIIWMFDTSISSEISFAKFKAAFNGGMLGIPGFLWKLVVLALIWAFLHHALAGLRHLWSDTHHSAVTKNFGKTSALVTLVVSIGLTVILGAKLFGAY